MHREAQTGQPNAHRASLVVVFLTVFIDLLGFGMVLPLLPLYAKQFAGDMTKGQLGLAIGLLMASFSAMQFLFAPLWGRLSDRIGRRPVLLIGLAGSTIFYFLFGVATIYHSLTGLFITRIAAGICGATISTAQAYIADVTTLETRARGMALIGAAFGLGFTFGPLLGFAALLFSGDNLGLSPWPGYTAAAFSGLALLLAITQLKESLREGSDRARGGWLDLAGVRQAITTPSIAALMFVNFVAIFAFANFESTLALLLEETRGFGMGFRDVLLMFAYIGFLLSLAQGVLVRRLSGRISEAKLGAAGILVMDLGFGLLVWASTAHSMPLLYLALAVVVVGFALLNPSLQSLISRRSDPARQGSVLGISQSVSSLARIAGPVVGNVLFESVSPSSPYWFAAALVLIAGGLLMGAVRGGGDYPVQPSQA